MPAARTTLAHFSVSSAISLPNSAGEPGSGSPPTATMTGPSGTSPRRQGFNF